MQNKISVLMTVYNASKFLKDSIKSVLNQTYKNWELVIVDDHSNDDSLKIIKSFKNKKIKVFSLKKRIGRTNALNFGLKKIKGDLIAILDADDIANKKRFEEQINFFKYNKESLLVGSWCKVIDDKGKFIEFLNPSIEEKKIYQNMTHQNIFCHSSIMYKKKILKKIGNYPSHLVYSQDYGFILKSMKLNTPKIIPKYLASIRRWNNSMTYSPKYKKFYVKEKIVNLRFTLKNFKLSYTSKILWMLRFLKALLEFTLIKKYLY